MVATVLALSAFAVSLNLPIDLTRQFVAYADAASTCAAVATSPNDADGWRRLGKLLHGKGRLEAAQRSLERAVDLAPRDASLRIDLANVQRSIGRFGASTSTLLAAEDITGKPDQSLCYFRAPGSEARREAPPAPSEARSERVSETIWTTAFADAAECDWVIETAEAFNAARGGWGNPPPRYAPKGTVGDAVRAPHMLVADCAELNEWLNRKLETVVWPALGAQFGAKASEEMWLYDAFFLRFDGGPGRQGLDMHIDDDGLGLSINLLLSDPACDFEGGGTYFEDGDVTVTPRRGELVSHAGGLKHASVPTTAGRRYIMVGFLRAPSLLVEPPDYLENYDVNAQAAAAFALAGGGGGA